MDTQATELPRDFSNELQGSPNITAMPSDSNSRYQTEGDLKKFNWTEDSKLKYTETTKSKCPTQLRNREKRKLLKSSNVSAELPIEIFQMNSKKVQTSQPCHLIPTQDTKLKMILSQLAAQRINLQNQPNQSPNTIENLKKRKSLQSNDLTAKYQELYTAI